jgi:hypothetical protein
VAIVDTLGIADELARDGVFSREQAERLARVSGRVATEALATKADIKAIRSEIGRLRDEIVSEIARTRTDLKHAILVNRRELEVQNQVVNRETIKGVTGILLAHGIAVIGVTVTLVKLL